MGVTRLSLGVENFDDRILELNGRAHRSPEIGRVYRYARALGFPQINIDLIAGMLGETDENWRACIAAHARPRAGQRHHLPDGAAVQHDDQRRPAEGDRPVRRPGRDWATKRRWVARGLRGARAGRLSHRQRLHGREESATTKFVYRDRLWQGADLVGLGVASFGHVNGVHLQNLDTWETYSAAIERGELPLGRAYRPTAEERMIREFVLQLKTRLASARRTSQRSTASTCSSASASRSRRSRPTATWPRRRRERIALTRDGLLRVDVLLHRFFLPEHATSATPKLGHDACI